MVDEESLQRLENCVVGSANGWFDAEWLEENFRVQRVFDLKVKKLSGNQFLIQFEKKNGVLKMEKEGWKWLKQWLSKVVRWSVDFNCKRRDTWVYCYGVPLHAWNYETFRNIASIWGELLKVEEETLNLSNVCNGKLFIRTDCLLKINELINVTYGKFCYEVRISKVECGSSSGQSFIPKSMEGLNAGLMNNIMGNSKCSGHEYRKRDEEDEQEDLNNDGDRSIEDDNEFMVRSERAERVYKNCSLGGLRVIGENINDLSNKAINIGAQEDVSKSNEIDVVPTKDRGSTWQTSEYVGESVDVDGIDLWAKVVDNTNELDLNFGKQMLKSIETDPISKSTDKREGGSVVVLHGPSDKEDLPVYTSNNSQPWSKGGFLLQSSRKGKISGKR